MPSRLIQLKDIDSSPNDLLFPITTGEAVSVTFDGASHTLQSVVDLIPTADSGSGGGSTQTIAANSVTLSTSPRPYISLDGGGTYNTIQLPDSCPWSISLGNIDSSGSITNGTLSPASSQNLVVTDTTGLVSKSSLSFDATDTSAYLRHDGTWATVSTGSTVAGKTVTLGTTAKAVIQVNGSDSGSVSLPAAATNAVGIVQLTDSTSSTSTTTAATPNSVKLAYDLAAAAIPKSVGTAQGDIIYFSSSGNPTRLAKGTAGQVLTMNSGATAPTWVTPSSGVSTHSLLSSSVHTDTTDGSPASGNIIVGNGTKWTSQSFETFANTYHAVPLVGHFDTEGFTLWYLLNLSSLLNDNRFFDDPTEILSAASDTDSAIYSALQTFGRSSLSKFTVTDLTASEIITAMESGRPVYIIADFDATELGLDSENAEQVYQMFGKPRMVFTPIQFYPYPGGKEINRIEFVSMCGVSYIGGIQVSWDVSAVDPQNPPSDFSVGCGMIMLPRYDNTAYQKTNNMPFNTNGSIKYQTSGNSGDKLLLGERDSDSGDYILKYSNIELGSSTTTFLRNDGQWATPSGGSGGGGDTVTGKTVTLSTTGQAVIQVNSSDSGTVALPSDIPSTWIGSTSTTASAGDHTHGDITYNGKIQTTPANIATSDSLVIVSSSNSRIHKTAITFDTSNTTDFLRKDGTWATPSGGSGSGGYSFKYDEFTTFDTTNQGELKVTVSNTSSTEKLFTYVLVGSAYYQDIDQGDAKVLVNITTNGTVSPGEHYLAINNQVRDNGNSLPLPVVSEMILINGVPPVYHKVSSSSGAWDDIPYGVTRLYSYIILNHNGSLIGSPSVFITWCGDYYEL